MLRKLHGLGLVALALPAWLPEVAKLVSVKSGKITKVLVIRIIFVLVLVIVTKISLFITLGS